MQFVMENYKKWVDPAPLVRKIEDADLSSKEPIAPTGNGTRDPTEITKKRYELELEKHLDRADILEDNITKLYSPLWEKCTEA